MDEMVMEIVRLALMLAGFLLCGYLLPWIRQKVGATKTEQLENYVKQAVYAVQQLFWQKTGEERRAKAIELIADWCAKNNISVTQGQIRVLIEAAVKGMHIAEGKAYDGNNGSNTNG